MLTTESHDATPVATGVELRRVSRGLSNGVVTESEVSSSRKLSQIAVQALYGQEVLPLVVTEAKEINRRGNVCPVEMPRGLASNHGLRPHLSHDTVTGVLLVSESSQPTGSVL